MKLKRRRRHCPTTRTWASLPTWRTWNTRHRNTRRNTCQGIHIGIPIGGHEYPAKEYLDHYPTWRCRNSGAALGVRCGIPETQLGGCHYLSSRCRAYLGVTTPLYPASRCGNTGCHHLYLALYEKEFLDSNRNTNRIPLNQLRRVSQLHLVLRCYPTSFGRPGRHYPHLAL